MKKIYLIVIIIFTANFIFAQNFGSRLGNAVKRTAENTVERKLEEKTDEAISKGIDEVTDPESYENEDEESSKKNTDKGKAWKCSCGHSGNTGKFCTECGAKQPSANGWTCSQCGTEGNKGKFCTECGAKQDAGDEGNNASATDVSEPSPQKANTKPLEMTYAKCDFVAGDVIIFEDLLEGEQLGEFPSKWDLERGNAEIAKINGETVIAMGAADCWIAPLMMNNSKDYLGDVFTVEYDMLFDDSGKDGAPDVEIDFIAPDQSRDNEIFTFEYDYAFEIQDFTVYYVKNGSEKETYKDGSASSGEVAVINDGKWHHFALSFNKRALKVYVDGIRIINIPNAKLGAGWVTFFSRCSNESKPLHMKNVRIAKGAVPLYDRMMTDGKFITYGITFDVGKSTIKPESMGEINRIVKLMTDNPDLKFSVEGHTDNTGNLALNQTLSEARSKAIVEKLVEMGIDKSRLASAGKGQNNPISDNSTPEGRAKNRRVEFVKL